MSALLALLFALDPAIQIASSARCADSPSVTAQLVELVHDPELGKGFVASLDDNVSNPVSVARYVSNHERLVPCFATAIANYFLTSWNGAADPEFAWKAFNFEGRSGNAVPRIGDTLEGRLTGKTDAADIIATVVRFMFETKQFPWS
ncbi:MAG: hypothetical protein SGI86_22615 [Deltaproteobacteria bacterium]|nr:hypothetical protein [Deltaproteobacteria bacterium]